MDPRVYSTLEFDKVRELLANRASFRLAKQLAHELEPSVSLRQVDRWLDETDQARRLIETGGRPPFQGLVDIRGFVHRASIGGILQGEELLNIVSTIQTVARLRSYFLKDDALDQAPTIADLAESLGVFTRLDKELIRCIDRDGHVTDHASPELARIRSRLRTQRHRVRDYLERLTRGAQGRRYLQEPIITIRSGRYVVPVKQEYRSEIPGVIHDQSTSGATLFVEPMPVVELNNTIRQAEREEEREIHRILTHLSQLVAADAEQLTAAVELAAELDFICAKASLALDWEAVRPSLNDSGWLRIDKGRHPLLSEPIVPIDVWLGKEFTTLIITGPNTGGKTVTLKTVGLFCLMAQAGLHVPAEPGTELCVFRNIFADIGDEQSIEQSLSTFSAHMSNIVSILERVDSQSLVLLDELGAGTDPTEGAGLAIAILETLCDHVGCRTIATTHYNELKSFAYSHPRCENASVEFDVETLQPTYRLAIGVAGKSNAFAIARRLGLDSDIVARAEHRLSHEERTVEALLQSVEEDRRRAAKEREEAETLRRRYEELREQYDQAYARLKERREAMLEEAKEEARTLLQRTRRKAERLLGSLRKAGQGSQDRLEKVARDVRAQLDDTLQSVAERLQRDELSEENGRERRILPEPPTVGDRVSVQSLRQEGEVVQLLADGKVAIQIGPMRVQVDLDDVQKLRGRSSRPIQVGGYGEMARRKAMEVKNEINLRGMLVEEALEHVDKYLDDAVLAGVPVVRLIHGKGTGALRRAIQQFLSEDRRVKEFRLGEPSEGGSGVTTVTL